MIPKYNQKFINSYSNTYGSIYPSHYATMLETSNFGFIRLYISNKMDKTPISNATITIYVTDGMQRDIPIMHLITTLNPIRIELPMAYDLGTQIAGPEYDFSTYNLRVDAFGYFARNIYNIRLFPGTTSNFNIELVPVRQLEAQPLIEERIDIPPHPRDVINGVNS